MKRVWCYEPPVGSAARCPACGNEASTFLFNAREMFGGARFEIRTCDGCALRFTRDELTTSELASFYHYEGGADAGSRFRGPLEPLMRALRRARLAQLTADHKEPGRFLDVGCARGVTMAAMAERGWDVYGVELDADVAATARSVHGDRIFIGGIETVPKDIAPFDVISFWHVFEHLNDPFAALESAVSLLAKNGTIIIALPNADSWQAKLFGASWLHLDVPRHRFHFSEATLGKLAERFGLEMMSSAQFSLEYGPYGVFQSALAKSGFGHSLFTRVLRPTRGKSLLFEPALWAHLAIAAPIAALVPVSIAVEAAASALGRGGCPVFLLRRRADAPIEMRSTR